MSHKISLLVLGLLTFAGVFAQHKKNTVDEVIWVVGDSPILLSDVEEYRLEAEMAGQKIPYTSIPERLAIQKLFLHQAELDSITIGEADLMHYADQRLNEAIQFYGSRENLEMALNKTIPQIREMFKEQTRNMEIPNMVRRKLTENIRVTPAEVRDFFSKLPKDSLPLVPTQVELQIITAAPKPSREEVERIEERLRDFTRRINEGEADFARLARLYSQDGSARNGGELGMSGRNQWVPEFANVAFSLNDPKKVSKIVRTEFGFHILQFIEKRGEKVNVRHILLRPEIQESEFEKNIARLDSIANDIKEEKFSFEIAAQQLSDDKDSRNNNGLMVARDEEGNILSARFELTQLNRELAKVVENLKVGEISKAFRMVDPKSGSEICAIVKLKNRIEEHRANFTDDFRLLKNVVMNQRQNEAVRKWLTEKIKTTYTRINPEWRNLTFEHEGWVK
ncbi:peptidylprolyl isomerase [Alloprevotella sp. OH1205_COT-284]|uniref:peptidylprolyl isomerase n=1 Tax=Alloprevotella sp. OH1205_COT-284 TaxID=2491043 RepID=UPI000F5D4F7B|nr:peptidylprolyl isomerase [Alloprevotella sp. OH1205_COT-284]RRD76186.1 peptidylprolyl isomerase [Alloprevotella sp. OH1205_COT-284]